MSLQVIEWMGFKFIILNRVTKLISFRMKKGIIHLQYVFDI
ncbi:hypothetical protein HMPREF1604_04614 [Escherichia coli 908519]|nr:hypothetical protein HMPREF1604_04614 [Escherichia coli 908519]UVX22211.1 hypothetical protein [Escherichia coli]UWM22023.1 hypothetical protein [Morganella morganii]UWM22324.1 hypothetical protein [Klebsiella pneumoniae]UWM21357.1 hypothetical protein [Escherichia coli]